MATESKLVASNTTSFGQAVAVSGDYAIVGGRQPSSTSLVSPGQAHIFVFDGTTWTVQATLELPTPPDQGDRFGEAVAVEGDTALVGAANEPPTFAGRVHVYRRSGSVWSEEAVLAPDDGVFLGSFGASVALSGDWVIVGSDQGAYAFQRTGTTWSQHSKLSGTNSPSGFFVALSGSTAVINASQNHVLVFERVGNGWQQQASLASSEPGGGGFFGGALSISGDYIIVGDISAKQTGSDHSGAAYIFERSGSSWVQMAKLESDPPSSKNNFGRSVAISGDYAIVGDDSDADVAPGSGAVYVYRRKGAGWLQLEKIVASDAAIFDWFGNPVAIDGFGFSPRAITAAQGHNYSGAAYVLSAFSGAGGAPIDPNRWILVAKILFGLVGGGGGVIWLPGTGPVPVDPEPFKTLSQMSPRQRDLLLGLAVNELASLVADAAARTELQTAAIKLTQRSAGRLQTGAAVVDVPARHQRE